MNEAFLQIQRLRKEFGKTPVVNGLDLDIKQGEFVSLLGASGCGKTTTLQMIAGFEKPTSGSIRLNGKDITDMPPSKREIGIVFQNYALFPHMTVEENIVFGLSLRKVDKTAKRKRLMELLELVHLQGLEARYPRELSGGQQQRVAIARALAIEPNVLLLDEPFSNLDARLRADMQNEVKRLQLETGITTILVTHDQSEAMGLSDRLAIMHKGVALQVDTPQAVYDNPATRYVGNFLGNINVLNAKLQSRGESTLGFSAGQKDYLVENRLKLDPEKCCVSIRPERVRIQPKPSDCEIHVPGTVVTKSYNGNSWDIGTETELGTIGINVPHHGGSTPGRGERVVLGWNSVDMKVVHGD
ncbi:ABC transporter ATP-binding protein [Xanthomonas axonopodis]|uniref:ABC transporter ATP-binding protein n=1 Tax=Xanthomonas axonopodis TaxID=53413 RepID=UPI003557DDE1